MASIIEIIIQGQDQSGPAFASAARNLQGMAQAAAGAQTGIVRVGQTTQQAAAQAGTGLARVEARAEGAEAAIVTLGIAGSTTATRMRSLNVVIENQEQALVIAARRLAEVRAEHDADSLAVGRAQLAYDRLNRTLANNRARLQDLRTSGDVTGIQVLGPSMGGRAAEGLAGGIGGLQGAAATLGLAIGGAELVRFGADAIRSANDLQQAEAGIRALSGTQERYNDVLALSRRNQQLYGGTLQDNLESFRGLVPLARSTGAELEALNQTTRKLTILDPAQGPEGAAMAIREFLTADTAEGARSLAERFELPRAAIQNIITTTDDATERLKALNQVLTDQGVTNETLAATTNTTAAAYERLGAAWSNATTAGGGLLSRALEPLAVQATGVLELLTGDFQSGLRDLYTGGNMAAGYSREDALRRVPRQFRGEPAAATTGPQSAFVTPGPAPTSGSALIAPSDAAQQPTSVTTVTVNVAGSVTTERELTDTIRRNLIQTGRQNGINAVQP